jgi:CrcB protein
MALVAFGGACGSLARYLVSGWAQTWSRQSVFPVGTLAVNLVGCFLIGVLSVWTFERGFFNLQGRLLFIVGVLGGFTTFSAFGYETMTLLRDHEGWQAGLNVLASIGGGFTGVWLGWIVGRWGT